LPSVPGLVQRNCVLFPSHPELLDLSFGLWKMNKTTSYGGLAGKSGVEPRSWTYSRAAPTSARWHYPS
jgi:hypothetical protein